MIALTAYVMREHRAAIDAAGADGVIAKPILSIEQFGADILRYMRKRPTPAITDVEDECAGSANDANAPVIDRNIYDSLAEAIGPDAMVGLLGKVGPDVQGARDRLVRALDPIDLVEIRSVTHILISVAGAIGAVPVQERAKQMNVAGHRDDVAVIQREMQGLLGQIDRTLEFVKNQING